MLVLELNEFDPTYFYKASKKLELENIVWLLSLKRSKTTTNEEKEHHGLDPWVQWVSIHTGRPFQEHKIARLGDTISQKEDQIWNYLSRHNGIHCGIWGVMNAPCGPRANIDFFIPDPWSFNENAFPLDLNDFLAFPRYMAKNYLNPEKTKVISLSMRMIRFIMNNKGNKKTRNFLKICYKAIKSVGINIHSLLVILDYLSTLYFIEFQKKYDSEFNVIFLNHIAHLQHQFWDDPENINKEMKFGLIVCNEIIGLLKNSLKKDEPLIVLNGLKQKLVKGKGFNIYRQRDPIQFIREIGIKNVTVEQNMTNDGILIFKEKKECDSALNLLSRIHLQISSINLFHLERLNDFKLFYQIDIEKDISRDENIILDNKILFSFYDVIDRICERTGAHIQEGDIFSQNIFLPDHLFNHEVFDFILKGFEVTKD